MHKRLKSYTTRLHFIMMHRYRTAYRNAKQAHTTPFPRNSPLEECELSNSASISEAVPTTNKNPQDFTEVFDLPSKEGLASSLEPDNSSQTALPITSNLAILHGNTHIDELAQTPKRFQLTKNIISQENDSNINEQESLKCQNASADPSMPLESDSFIYIPTLHEESKVVSDQERISIFGDRKKTHTTERSDRVLLGHLSPIKSGVEYSLKAINQTREKLSELSRYYGTVLTEAQNEVQNLKEQNGRLKENELRMEIESADHIAFLEQDYDRNRLQFMGGIFEKASGIKNGILQELENYVKSLQDNIDSNISLREEQLQRLHDELKDMHNRYERLEATFRSKEMEIQTSEDALGCMTKCYEREKDASAQLRLMNIKLLQEIEALKTSFSALVIHTLDAQHSHQKEASMNQSHSNSMLHALQTLEEEILSIKNHIHPSLSGLEQSLRQVLKHIGTREEELLEALDCHRSRVTQLETELNDEIAKREMAGNSAKMVSEALSEAKDELILKSKYITDMEKQVEELMVSNKFYEEQLIESDKAIKELREKQCKRGIDINEELNKIRQKYFKENMLLKVRVEELELSLKQSHL